jgi:P27 family predicted phage terminase small subunit
LQITPRCPEYLDHRAKQEWKRLIPILKSMKVLTEADGLMLANLCQAVSMLAKAQQTLNEKGFLYKAPSGYVMQSPLLAVVNQCVDTITKLSREFGLSPAARSRMMAAPANQQEECAAALAELQVTLNRPRKLNFIPKDAEIYRRPAEPEKPN